MNGRVAFILLSIRDRKNKADLSNMYGQMLIASETLTDVAWGQIVAAHRERLSREPDYGLRLWMLGGLASVMLPLNTVVISTSVHEAVVSLICEQLELLQSTRVTPAADSDLSMVLLVNALECAARSDKAVAARSRATLQEIVSGEECFGVMTAYAARALHSLPAVTAQ